MVQWDGKTGSRAMLAFNSILKIDVLIGVICLREGSALMRPVSIRLQAKENDLVATLQDQNEVLKTLKNGAWIQLMNLILFLKN